MHFLKALLDFFVFVGTYLLRMDHFFENQMKPFLITAVALAFALTPVWPSGMLSTLGMPLALWAFLNICAGKLTNKDCCTL